MRTSVTLKLIVIPAVAYMTWLATSSIRAQQTKAVAVAPARVVSGKFDAGATPAAAPAAPGRPGKLVASILLDQGSITVQGDFIQVHASVLMKFSYQGTRFLWRLAVTDPATDAVLSDVPYLNQQFRMGPSGTMNPTFDEALQLPRGKYRVSLSLYKIPEDLTVEQMLDAPDVAALCTAVRITETVALP